MILVMVDTEMEMTGKGGAQAYNYYIIIGMIIMMM